MSTIIFTFLKKLIHSLSTDLSTGALCARVLKLSPKTKPPWAPKCKS